MQQYQAFKLLLKKFITPHTKDKKVARREFILNVLLLGLLILSSIGFFINLLRPLINPSSDGQSPILTGAVVAFLTVLKILSRLGKSILAANIFIWFLLLLGLFMAFYWGADLPAALLFFSLLIIMAGILISTKFAFITTLIIGIGIVTITYLEIHGLHLPNNDWKNSPILLTDSLVYGIILGVIALVAWLSNREIEKALRRAQRSEAIVKKQRDNLEVLVEERTKELKKAQVEKLNQVYRFAEFGRMASGLFHDLATPLSLVSLNLDLLDSQNKKGKKLSLEASQMLMQRALLGTRRLEDFLSAARRQVQNQDEITKFYVNAEIKNALQIFDYKARKANVAIEVITSKKVYLRGNSPKFNQVITNLVSNAIDSYSRSYKKSKKIEIHVNKIKDLLEIIIQDWGSGIDSRNLKKIFEPLFTTKGKKYGMGMGLSICKEIVEKDFGGTIQVKSKKNIGTTFLIQIPTQK